MNDFEAFVRSLGIRPRGPVVADGKWHRCGTEDQPRKRNGAWKLAPDGRVGWAQDWSCMDSPATWRPGEDANLPAYDPAAAREAMREADARRRKAIRAARAFYEKCRPLRGGHPYLDSHGLTMAGCQGLKVDRDGWLVVPALQARQVMSVQRISPEGDKRFWTGAPVAGTSYVIEHRGATVNVLCEGLATGLACYRVLPHSRVIVAWNAGNLSRVPVPPGLTVVAADNDHGTEDRRGFNPGIEAAREAAAEIGCGIAYPEGIKGTDWADYLVERYAVEVARKTEYQTRAMVRDKVDAEARRALMMQAKFVAREQAGAA